jgi:hypothetical protein
MSGTARQLPRSQGALAMARFTTAPPHRLMFPSPALHGHFSSAPLTMEFGSDYPRRCDQFTPHMTTRAHGRDPAPPEPVPCIVVCREGRGSCELQLQRRGSGSAPLPAFQKGNMSASRKEGCSSPVEGGPSKRARTQEDLKSSINSSGTQNPTFPWQVACDPGGCRQSTQPEATMPTRESRPRRHVTAKNGSSSKGYPDIPHIAYDTATPKQSRRQQQTIPQETPPSGLGQSGYRYTRLQRATATCSGIASARHCCIRQ